MLSTNVKNASLLKYFLLLEYFTINSLLLFSFGDVNSTAMYQQSIVVLKLTKHLTKFNTFLYDETFLYSFTLIR